jgi:pyridoxal phosphate enzyme (YggS family)
MHTQSLLIREWKVQDGAAFFEISKDKELNLGSSSSLVQKSQDDAERKVIEWALITNQTKMGYFPIFLESSKELIGLCRLKPAPSAEKMGFEVTSHIVSKHLGNDYGDEASTALSDYAKINIGITEVCIRHPLNKLKACLPQSCKILAVSKLQNMMKIRQLNKQGQILFAENYVKEALEKQEDLKDLSLEWHLIGHLQKNKAKQVVGNFALIHSVDSVELATVLDKQAESISANQKILLQVNLAGEETKGGFSKEELLEKFPTLVTLKNLKICGLMTMPPLFDNPEQARPFFKELRELSEKLRADFKLNDDFCELSMGTSSDYMIAAQEGATIVRLGTVLFGERS